MGFYSFLDSKTGQSIPAFPYADFNKKESEVCIVLPDDSVIKGTYDGYGRIGQANVYDLISPFVSGFSTDSDFIFNNEKTIKFKDKLVTVSVFSYEKPLDEFDGLTLNDITKLGGEITTNFNRATKLIKIVKLSNYNGEKFDDLSVSQCCPFQGFFYDSDFDLNNDYRTFKNY